MIATNGPCWGSALLLMVFLAGCGITTPFEEGPRAINDVHLYCKVVGTGEPIIVVHGGPGMDHTYFLPQMAGLAETHRLIFFDQRASGRSSSSMDPGEVTLENFIADIEGVRKSFGIEKMNLMAHSWGGVPAMAYATRHPQNLKSLMLIASSPASAALAAKAQSRLTDQDLSERAEILASESFKNHEPEAYGRLFRVIFRGGFYDRALAEQLTLTFQPGFKQQSALLMEGLAKDISDYDFHSGLAVVDCPTLVVHGDHDGLPLEGSEGIQRAIAGSRLVVLENCGHFPFIEKPQEFFATVRGFLDSVPD